MSGFELGGVLTGIAGVWLTTRQKIWCWPVGLVSVVLFIVVFYRARLYGAMILQVAYVALMIYGWLAWGRGGTDHGQLRVSRLPARAAALLVVVGVSTSALFGYWLHWRTDAALPYVDATTTSFSLVAQWMQARKHLENWIVWVVVDLVYIGMSLSQGLALTAGLYGVYVALAVLGYREWRRSLTPVDDDVSPAI
jgi:nicotinamide mononucleotide transporter